MSNIGGSKTPESGLTRGHHQGDSMPLASDFVKKLYNILEDTAVQSVVSWGPKGDCFVVKDVNQFSKTILPRVFNHSNFASFVRQLNKYDFHKVKSMGNERFGEDAWAFRHPDFLANRPDAVEKIKRKVPGQCVTQTIDAATALAIVQQQQQAAATAAFLGGSSTEPSFSAMNPSVGGLMSEIRGLRDDNEDVRRRLRTLEKDHRDVLVKMISFQQAMAHQNGLMQSAVAYMLGGNSSHQESPHDGISESTQENLQFISQQLQQQYRAPPPYSTQSPQPQYGGSGGYGKPSGGQLTPSSSIYSPELPMMLPTFGFAMQDASSSSSSTDLSSLHPSLSTPIDLLPSSTYLNNLGCGHGVPLTGTSGQEIGELGGTLGEGSHADCQHDPGMAGGSVNPYTIW